jgi:hypothetical protein
MAMLRTKSTLLALTCATLGLASGCDIFLGQVLVGSGIPVIEVRETEPFLGVDVGGAIHAEVIVGQPQSIEISGDDNIVPFIITDVRDGTLVIKTDHRGRMRPKERLMVTIVTPELQRLDVSGACDVEVEGLEAGEFNVDISGASQVAVSGRCDQLVAGISGASELQAVGMEAESVKIDASGASSAKVMATDYLIADASGASTIRYAGDPGSVKVDKSGASSIKAIRVASEE